ncbi:peptidoglycan editing factor PgeF [Meiothermus granaticius]|uniref:Purine nucleoside phosphorylase n=1 Tax=Meiothermus granaticius NBRC 107808 TaxID=1227551 RepID=A0A399F7V4_9DEIN|nr:peptidoglycan editing factor PgeF [Meiothermus granaticius]MCL6525289.1 peptidoglycan editing factor PgeF [Thermaceae bacterium]RIH91746.1 Laccase domain protein YfiH [Meiothermus granaticius NBRC 107808]GEM88130.1 laccase domain protein [Meiothermus granaticius NBRC 107808]
MLTSPLIPVPHGFTTREGGVSEGAYASLNLSAFTGDAPERVAENQRRVLERFGHPPVALLNQQHGTVVHAVEEAGVWEGDGLLTHQPGLLLRVGVADCYPVLLYDPVHNAIGALHAGWRGSVGGILPKALERLRERYGSQPEDLRVAVGPGISGPNFQVGPEVIEWVEQAGLGARLPSGAPIYWPDPHTAGKYRLDLEAVLRQQALGAGVQPQNYWALGACTYADGRFFSHRRDQGRTGRMWALIQLPPLG